MLSSYRGNSNATLPQASGKPIKVTSLGAGSGTVSSVNLTAPAEFSVTGTPITTTGVIVLDWEDAPGNTVFAGPADGSSGRPVFRALTAADIPGGGVITPDGELFELEGTITALDTPFQIPDSEPGVTPPIRLFLVDTSSVVLDPLEIDMPGNPQPMEQIVIKRITTDGLEFQLVGSSGATVDGSTISDTSTSLTSYTLQYDSGSNTWWIVGGYLNAA